MKILDAGDHPLSNADVLDWLKRKRAQHTSEDAEDKAKKVKPAPRPANFMAALNRHERELASDKYPYVKNPHAYQGAARKTQFDKFVIQVENVVQDSLEARWKAKENLGDMPKQQVEKEFAAEQEKMCLTEPELLMIYNHAPICVEMLQPMVENVEDRFSGQEQMDIVETVIKVLRPDQKDIKLPSEQEQEQEAEDEG